MELIRRLLRRMTAVSAWPLWSLPRWLTAFVLTVVAVDAVAIGVAASVTTITAHDLLLFGLLLGCTALAVELSRRTGEPGGMIKDVQGVWELPVAILLPPLYALIAPITRIALMQWRVRRAPVLPAGVQQRIHRALLRRRIGDLPRPGPPVPRGSGGTLIRATVWTVLVTVAVLVKSILNKAMIMTAVKATDPGATIRTEVFSREPLYNDVAEMCISVLVTYGVASNPLLAPVALPVVTLLQRSLRHVELVNDSRADSKTGLLNAATWEREATAEVARAVRTEPR